MFYSFSIINFNLKISRLFKYFYLYFIFSLSFHPIVIDSWTQASPIDRHKDRSHDPHTVDSCNFDQIVSPLNYKTYITKICIIFKSSCNRYKNVVKVREAKAWWFFTHVIPSINVHQCLIIVTPNYVIIVVGQINIFIIIIFLLTFLFSMIT